MKKNKIKNQGAVTAPFLVSFTFCLTVVNFHIHHKPLGIISELFSEEIHSPHVDRVRLNSQLKADIVALPQTECVQIFL